MKYTTDLIVFGLLMFFAWRGWQRGLLRTIIEPLAFWFSLIIGIIFFDLTHNIAKAFFIVSVGTLALTLATHIILTVLSWGTDKKYRNQIVGISRLLGCAVNLFWRGILIASLVIIFYLIPVRSEQVQKIQDDIKHSSAYALIDQHIVSQNTTIQNIIAAFSIFKDPELIQRMAITEEFQAFFLDEKISSLSTDAEFLSSVQNNDIKAIANHPKIKAITQDDILMEKLMEAGKRVYSENSEEEY